MRKIYLATLLVVIGLAAFAQERCGFDAIHNERMRTDPQYAATINANNEYIRRYIAEHPPTASRTSTALYTIPVVVHVVHTGGAVGTIYNPTDAQVIGAINYLNSIYDGSDASLYGGVGDMQIQFALAQRDPNCNPTNGINHVDGSSIPNYTTYGVNRSNSNGATEASVKNFIRWDANNYYNIWVVNKIDGADGTSGSFIAGFAYFPGAGPTLDGTMMLATQMKTGAKTLPHEIGHALNLYHTFQGSNNSATCPLNNNCNTDGDMVCDTDPVPYPADFTCKVGTNPCTSLSYAINSENNFMGYTSCYTLFTAGQKARAIAAMSLPSRVSLANSLAATPTYSGTVQCTPKINFESSGTTVTETTTGTVDCRKYRDYTVNMTIANNPSATTTVALQLSGSASNMLDYQLTTNGSFTSPSSQLTFPAGSHANQSFTVRVFDNAIIDFQRTAIIDFTVNNGGGDALKGSANTSYTFAIGDNDFAPQAFSSASPTIGNNSAGSFFQPFRSSYTKGRTQALYLASELQTAGFVTGTSISSIGFSISNKGSSVPYNMNVKMKNTASTVLLTSGFESVPDVYYSGSYSSVWGANTIPLSTPFIWDGVSNVIVEFCYDNTTASGDDVINGTIQSTALCIWQRASSGTGCSLTAQYNSVTGVGYVRPDLSFTAQSGNPVAAILNTTQTEYLGPYGDIYFKSGNDIIGRMKNLTSFDYGCTSFKVDRAGNSSSNFWNTTTANNVTNKTFLITPTNTTGSGQYEVTLYYTDAEKTGYETSSGMSWNSTSMIRTPLAVSATNSSSTNPWQVKVQPTVTRSSFGSDFAVMGSFTGNLGAGFTIGDPAAVLPLRWVSFTGKIDKELNAELLWTTANEINTSHFDVEESANGFEFRKVGTVKSQGAGNNNYRFVHIKPAAGNHYYRIKQVDTDGRFTYSTIILLYIDNKYDIFAYPVPATDKLTIKFGKAVKDPVIEILSADMKLLKRESLTGLVFDKEISLKEFASGAYIARIVVDGKAQVLRFVKQ
jgi:hypothetical protein